MTWTYVDDYGTSHKVGLFHGDETGHLMIYCNAKVMFIDFHVQQNKKYSFFINDELFDVFVERNDGQFAYGCEIDQKSLTPRNQLRKEHDFKTNISVALFSLSIIAAITTGILLAWRYLFV